MPSSRCRLIGLGAAFWLVAAAQAGVTTPKEFFGFDVCQDYHLANYAQLVDYWRTLQKESGRIKLVSIGKTEEGRDQYMALISDPSNIRNAEAIRKTAERISKAKDIANDDEFWKLAKKSKTVIWIDGGLHANETLGAQQLIETAYRLVAGNDDDTKRILKDVMILLVHANPDGMDLVSNWYMRRKEPEKRSLANIPELYQKYAGHDNNRDLFQMNLAESRNMNRILYETWYPQVLYNHHQTAPQGTVMFIPPFRNPYNYHVDPLTQNATDLVGMHMHHRLLSEGKGGTVMRDGASFNSWWNGGVRTTTYFHNMVGILTETFGTPNPSPLRFLPERQVPSIDLPKPETARLWKMRDSLEYEVSANMAILDYASRYRERLLYAVYRAAKNSIERGGKDHWTRYPSRIKELGEKALEDPTLRDARAYVVHADQPNLGAAQRFVENLLRAGVEVSVAEETKGNIRKGSYIIRCDQAYRPHILDMFEPQDYPNDFRYPGGPPIAPYDSAGYTPAFSMGVKFDRLFEAPSVAARVVKSAVDRVEVAERKGTRFFLPLTDNDSFRTANLALKAGLTVLQTEEGFEISGQETDLATLRWESPFGQWLTRREPANGNGLSHRMPRIGLWDRFGGSMPSGWMRWLFDNFGFDYKVVFPPQFTAENLKTNFDVIVLPDGALGARDPIGDNTPRNPIDDDPTVDAKYKGRWGNLGNEEAKALDEFVKAGGHVVAIGSSSAAIAERLSLPVRNALVEADENGRMRAIANTKFYIPGSILQVKLNRTDLTAGLEERLDVMFDSSPAFQVAADAPVSIVAMFDTDKPLRSGWAWGQERLKGLTSIADVKWGKGRVLVCGPEINFRGQTHGAFKILFNALLRAGK